MNLSEKLFWTFVSIPVTAISIVAAIFFMGGGHGTYIPTIFLFPYSMLITLLYGKGTIPIAIGLTQFLVYGLITDLTKLLKRKSLAQVELGIYVLHLVIAVYVTLSKGDSF